MLLLFKNKQISPSVVFIYGDLLYFRTLVGWVVKTLAGSAELNEKFSQFKEYFIFNKGSYILWFDVIGFVDCFANLINFGINMLSYMSETVVKLNKTFRLTRYTAALRGKSLGMQPRNLHFH